MEKRHLIIPGLRADAKNPKLVGSIPYNSPADIGGMFTEILLPGCFSTALNRSENIFALKGHDANYPLANRDAGTLCFRDGADQLHVEILLDLDIGYHRDVYKAAQRGDLSGLSFGFATDREGERWIGNTREISEVSRLYEFSPCTFPAYQDSSLNARSAERENTMKYTMNNVRSLLEKMENLYRIPERENRDLTGAENIELNKLANQWDQVAPAVDSAFPTTRDRGVLGVIEHMSQTGTEYRTNPQDQGGDSRTRFEVGRNRSTQYRSMGEFLRDVAACGFDDNRPNQRLVEYQREIRAASGMSEGVLSDGGFLVAPEFANELLQDAMETGVLASRCKQVPMTRHKLTLPGVDETSRANGSRMGGVQAYWENEADEMTGSKPKFRQINLKAKKLTGLVYMTDELLEDAPACESWVKSGFSDEFGFKVDDALIRGAGAGEPLGILNAGCLVSQAAESGQPAATIIAQNVMNMFERMLTRSTRNAVWYINQACWNQIFSLHLEVGTAGVPLFIEPGKLKDAPYGAILGRPVEPLEQCEALGTVGDIIFADFSQYVLGMKNGLKSDSSMHVKFTTDEMAFRFILRVDGQPIRASALTPYKGSNDQSSFIVLETRG